MSVFIGSVERQSSLTVGIRYFVSDVERKPTGHPFRHRCAMNNSLDFGLVGV